MSVKTLFDEVAEGYDAAVTGFSPSGNNAHIKQLVDDIEAISKLKAKGTLLSIGCGTGVNLAEFALNGWNVYGCDLSEQMLRNARTNFPERTLVKADACALPFSENNFSITLCIDVIQYCDDLETLINSMGEVTKKNGVCILIWPNKHSIIRQIGSIVKSRGYRLGKKYVGTMHSKSKISKIFNIVFPCSQITHVRLLPSFAPSFLWKVVNRKPLRWILGNKYWALSYMAVGWCK